MQLTCGKGAGGLEKLPCRLRARLAACTAAAGSLMPWSKKGTSSSISLQCVCGQCQPMDDIWATQFPPPVDNSVDWLDFRRSYVELERCKALQSGANPSPCTQREGV